LLITNRHCVTYHKPLIFISFYQSLDWNTKLGAFLRQLCTFIAECVLIIIYTGRIRRNVCNNNLSFRHWPKCSVFALNCTAAVTAVQWYTASEPLLKLIKPTLWPSISQLVNLCTNEVGRIYCTLPYRKQHNVAFDTKMILSVFFMSCGEQRQKKKACGSDESD